MRKEQAIVFLLGALAFGCGVEQPVTPQAQTTLTAPVELTRFKSVQDAFKFLERMYKQVGAGFIKSGDLMAMYSEGVPLGHIFLVARLAYEFGMEPKDVLNMKEGDNGWKRVMQLLQIGGLGGHVNLGDYLKAIPDPGRVGEEEPTLPKPK